VTPHSAIPNAPLQESRHPFKNTLKSRSSSRTSPAPSSYNPQTDISAPPPTQIRKGKRSRRIGEGQTQWLFRTPLSPHPSPFRSWRAIAPGSTCRRRSASLRRQDLVVSSQQVHADAGVGWEWVYGGCDEAKGELDGRDRK